MLFSIDTSKRIAGSRSSPFLLLPPPRPLLQTELYTGTIFPRGYSPEYCVPYADVSQFRENERLFSSPFSVHSPAVNVELYLRRIAPKSYKAQAISRQIGLRLDEEPVSFLGIGRYVEAMLDAGIDEVRDWEILFGPRWDEGASNIFAEAASSRFVSINSLGSISQGR